MKNEPIPGPDLELLIASIDRNPLERAVRNAHTKPVYEIIIRDAGGDFPCGCVKVWIGECIAAYELSLFCHQKGIFATAEELFATAQEMIKKFKEDPSQLDYYQGYQETFVP